MVRDHQKYYIMPLWQFVYNKYRGKNNNIIYYMKLLCGNFDASSEREK